jgi:hypothetical protein
MKSRSIFVVLLGLVTLLMLTPVWAGDDGDNGDKIVVVAPDQTLYGKSYSELAGEWWNWADAEPPDTSPVLDEDGSFCALNQKGKIWFLAGM